MAAPFDDADLLKITAKFEQETKLSTLKYSLATVLAEVVISEHDSSSRILNLLQEHRCIHALVNIVHAQKRYSEKAFQLFLENLKSYIDVYLDDPWKDLLKVPYIERIAEAFLTLFYVRQPTDGVTKALFRLASAGHLFSIEVIHRFIQFLKENHAKDSLAENYNDTYYIICTLCIIIQNEHPHLYTILENIEQELVNSKLDRSLKTDFARIVAYSHADVRQPSLNVIEALVSCMPNSEFKMLSQSLCLVEITSTKMLWTPNPILLFILKQPSVRLSHKSLLNLLKELEQKNPSHIQTLINIFSLLNYRDYSHEPWSRKIFIQIAYLTGRPFIEAKQG